MLTQNQRFWILASGSAIQTESTDVPICIVETNPDSLIVNAEGVITDSGKCKHTDDDINGKKKKRKNNKSRHGETGSSAP